MGIGTFAGPICMLLGVGLLCVISALLRDRKLITDKVRNLGTKPELILHNFFKENHPECFNKKENALFP